MQTGVNESQLNKISKLVESFSGIRIPANKPLIGESVFTQCSGIHADGDNKNNLYFNDLLPERFGRTRQYALGKTSGKANMIKNLGDLGIVLDTESLKKVTERVIELGDKKETVTSEDLPYIVSDVLNNDIVEPKIKIINYSVTHTMGLRSVANVSLEINGERYEEFCDGDGQYDAFVKSLRKIYKRLGKTFPKLADYVITIPPGGKTDALVETVITWQNGLKTKGLDPDQNAAAIKATVRMLNIIENEFNLTKVKQESDSTDSQK
jgi:D-citramalate synthase